MPARIQHIGTLGVCRSIAIYGIAGSSGVGVVGTLKCWFLEGQIPECGWNETTTIAWGSIGRKIWVAHAPGIPTKVFPPPWVSDLDMNHGTRATHVPWCKPGSLTSGFLWSRWGENVLGITGACATHSFRYLVRGPWSIWFRFWQE